MFRPRSKGATIGDIEMYGIIGQFMAVDGKRNELIEILLAGTKDMPGCKLYAISEDSDDESAIWVTENAFRINALNLSPVNRLDPCRKASFKLGRDDCQAGANPNRIPVKTEIKIVKTRTLQSTPTSDARGMAPALN